MIAPRRRLALADSGRFKRKVEQDQRERWQAKDDYALPNISHNAHRLTTGAC
jgi:hypothetical protein